MSAYLHDRPFLMMLLDFARVIERANLIRATPSLARSAQSPARFRRLNLPRKGCLAAPFGVSSCSRGLPQALMYSLPNTKSPNQHRRLRFQGPELAVLKSTYHMINSDHGSHLGLARPDIASTATRDSSRLLQQLVIYCLSLRKPRGFEFEATKSVVLPVVLNLLEKSFEN